jgi:hypothetical protein
LQKEKEKTHWQLILMFTSSYFSSSVSVFFQTMACMLGKEQKMKKYSILGFNYLTNLNDLM